MYFYASQDVQDLLNGICGGTRVAINLYSNNKELLESTASDLERNFLPDVISLDISNYDSFEVFIQDLLMQLLLREDKPTDCRVEDTAIEEMNIRLLRRHIGRLLNSFSRQNSWICLILKNFDFAEKYWDDSACAWIRELVDSSRIPACIVLSTKPISEISEKPIGSSPLYNIFRTYAIGEG